MSSTRILVLTFLGALFGACASEPTSVLCPTTGILCPQGTVCAAAQPVCLVSSCGNGQKDTSEECDDGNILEGDGCSPTCRNEICGNNFQDPDEVCDDGNTESGDGCAADCRSEEDCGNSTINVNEECDDSNADNSDACVSCKNAICGDGYVRAGLEECDGDGNGNPNAVGDNCSSACLLEGCHNGRLDPGEECDDNNLDDTDACVLECKVAFCGDGEIRTGIEQCDGDVDTTGDGIPEDTCSDTCQLVGCGNGISDPGEQCDDGCLLGTAGVCEPIDNGDGCSSACTFENCGNGAVDAGEQCDDGGETAACNTDCTFSTCGDGKRNATDLEECDNGAGNGDTKNCTSACLLNVCDDNKVDGEFPGIEACDDGPLGNVDDGVGCSSTCMLEGCGNTTLDNGELCEDNNTNPNDACVNCQPARCGDGSVWTGVEQCDGSAGTKPAGHPEATCAGEMSPVACRWQYCGNGHIDGSEQCDDNNNTNGDGCTAGCLREYCGDGIDNNGSAEQCDGNGTGTGGQTATCDANCTIASCGDGIVNPLFVVPSSGGLVEQCDDSGNANNDGCSSTCQFERCGNGIVDPGEQCDGAAGTKPVGQPGATCGAVGVTACRWIYCGNGILDGSEQCDNGAANSNTAACRANCMINTCGDGFQLAGIEGCDQGANNGPTRDCTAVCQPNICGDGFPHTAGAATEQCDDGNQSNTDACTTTCNTPVCGDGELNGTEVCDFGAGNDAAAKPGTCPYGQATCAQCAMGCTALGTANGPYCGDGTCQGGSGETTATCTIDCPSCGNNILQAGEQCDNGMTSGDGCSSLCQVENGYTCDTASPTVCATDCGDGVRAGTEVCDDGNETGGDGCNATCAAEEMDWVCTEDANGLSTCTHTPDCGDGIIEGAEVCDYGTGDNNGVDCENGSPPAYGVSNACVACSSMCLPVVSMDFCGDNTQNGPEVCDGSDLDGETCVGLGFSGGTLACAASCGGFNTSACTAPSFNLTVTPAGTGTGSVMSDVGSINCPGTCTHSYTSGTTVVLTATPTGGSTFVGWTGSGFTCPGTGTCSVTMSAARNVTATFNPPPSFALTVTVVNAGTVSSAPAGITTCAAASGDCTENYASGTMVTLTASANTTWAGCASSTMTTCDVTMDAAKAVTATFP